MAIIALKNRCDVIVHVNRARVNAKLEPIFTQMFIA